MQIILRKLTPTFIEEEKVFRSQIWNHDIVFSKQEHVQIIAPSGSGKTSLVHFLYGLRKEYTGHILYHEKDIRQFDAEQFSVYRRQFISIVFQDLRLFPGQTVLQNIEIKRQLAPFHSQSRIVEMASRLGIENKLDKLCSTCSYGEQQRIAIIRALQQPYEFLLLDEPFSHLDTANSRKAMELMEEESELRKASIILANLEEVEDFKASRVINL